MFDKKRIETVLIENGMHPGCIDLDAELDKYKQEMRDGLARQGGSSLLMLPTFIGLAEALPREQSAIVIDAGGTNLRIGRVRFDQNSKPVVEHFDKYPMPGTEGTRTKDEMFDEIAAYVGPLLKGGDNIGFCFSFVFESLPDHDGIIEGMSKEVYVTGVEGARACAELEAALQRAGHAEDGRSYVMINDTVATLLGAKAVHSADCYDSYAGLILGTGMNACYVEQTANIPKLAPGGYTERNMIINMEAGIYTGLAQGTVDKAVDERSQIPGDHAFEKMVSGGYFGDVLYGTLQLLIAAGLFSDAAAEKFRALETVSLKAVTRYIEGRADADNVFRLVAENDATDAQTLDTMLDLLYERCAKMVVILLCAVAEQADAGGSPEKALCMCAEGTTFYRSPLLTKHLDILMQDYVVAQRKRYIRIVSTEDATLVGTALAALTN